MLLICTFFGKKVGVDQFKNSYFVLLFKDHFDRHKRICVYNGIPEASKVPPHWADWIHFRTNTTPQTNYKPKYSWMLSSLPNLTLSKYKYRQLTHPKYNQGFDLIPRLNLKNKTGVRHYKSWSPE